MGGTHDALAAPARDQSTRHDGADGSRAHDNISFRRRRWFLVPLANRGKDLAAPMHDAHALPRMGIPGAMPNGPCLQQQGMQQSRGAGFSRRLFRAGCAIVGHTLAIAAKVVEVVTGQRSQRSRGRGCQDLSLLLEEWPSEIEKPAAPDLAETYTKVIEGLTPGGSDMPERKARPGMALACTELR